jgi:hypothetical protein
MATDYDTPRTTDDEIGEDSIEELKSRRDARTGSVDVDEAELAESLELPGADLSGEELAIKVLPRQADEFTCSHCFLVHHRSQLGVYRTGPLICRVCGALSWGLSRHTVRARRPGPSRRVATTCPVSSPG